MIQIEYKCGCKEMNFDYGKCPIHQKDLVKRFKIDNVLLAKIRAQIELMTTENMLAVNEIEELQERLDLQMDLSKFDNWKKWNSIEALEVDCYLSILQKGK